MSRSTASSPGSILRNKRLRFDDSPTPSASASTSSSASKLTPTAAAKEKIISTVATLPQELQSTATALATTVFIAYTKWYNKDKKCTAINNDSESFPNPLNFKIELQLMKEVMEGQDSKALSTELDAAVLKARNALKTFIVQGMELERAHLRRKAIEAVATALPSLAELLLALVDGEAYGKHTLVHDFLHCYGAEVWSYLNTSNTDFGAIYLEPSQEAPPPPAQVFHPIINGHETCINALQCLVSAIVAAKEKYHSSINENEKAVRLAKVMGNQQRAQKTDDAAMQLEEEETLPPATLASLTDQKVEKKTKPIKQDVAAMKKEMEKLKKQLEKLSTSKNSPKSNKSSNNST
ncbi:hypothetical protein ACHAXN_001368 [Cyclotella atomus]